MAILTIGTLVRLNPRPDSYYARCDLGKVGIITGQIEDMLWNGVSHKQYKIKVSQKETIDWFDEDDLEVIGFIRQK